MKNKFKILIISLLFIPLTIFSQWQNVSNNFPLDIIHAGYAIDAVQNCALVSIVYSTNIGVYPDTFRIFKTTDIGNSWTEIAPPYYGQDEVTNDLSIVDPLYYWLATDEGRILATTNGGDNWTVQFENNALTQFINYIEMFDLNNGIAMGDGLSDIPIILRTSDGGQNWVSVNSSSLGGISGDIWKRIDFIDSDNGYFNPYSVSTQKIFKTTNCCTNWDEIGSGNNIYVLKFFDINHGMFLTISGSGKRTLDGGVTWENITSNFEGLPTDIEYIGNTYGNVWVITNHKMYFSSDFGDAWINYSVNDNILLYDIKFIDENNGWLLTNEGVFFTDNNANITQVDEQKNIITEFSLFQNYPNPFNPSTKINWQSPVSSWQTLKVYDLLGNEVTTLFEGYKPTGSYEVEFNAAILPSGVYFYRLRAGAYTSVKKMILLR